MVVTTATTPTDYPMTSSHRVPKMADSIQQASSAAGEHQFREPVRKVKSVADLENWTKSQVAKCNGRVLLLWCGVVKCTMYLQLGRGSRDPPEAPPCVDCVF